MWKEEREGGSRPVRVLLDIQAGLEEVQVKTEFVWSREVDGCIRIVSSP